jgi:cyclophilin family peptidyl-prolyl cis-trans isomerase
MMRVVWRPFIAASCAALLAAACDRAVAPEQKRSGAVAPATPSASSLPSSTARESGHTSTELLPSASIAHDPAARRAAARTLARVGDARALAELGALLADEDDEVVAWAAYGLGAGCEGREPATVRALVARAASLGSGAPHGRLSAPGAISDAIGRCGTESAERTLAAWLQASRDWAAAAALALGRVAERRHSLDDATLVALLEAASKPDGADGALYPFTHVESLSDATRKRLHDVAIHMVASGGERRSFAIRALAAAGPDAANDLSSWLADSHFSAADRCAAAVTLGRLGRDAGDALGHALAQMVPNGVSAEERWLSESFAPLTAALGALGGEAGPATEALTRLADLTVPASGGPAVVRRVVGLRCAASGVLAGDDVRSPRLLHCDPDVQGRTGALALVRVLDRGELAGPRLDAWKTLVGSNDLAARRAALALLPRHPEAAWAVTELLVKALAAREPGIVAQAARAVAALPPAEPTSGALERVSHHARPPKDLEAERAQLVEALGHAMDASRPPDQIEPRLALADAAAALSALSLRARVERYCGDQNVTLRRGAEAALRRLGAEGASCAPPQRPEKLEAVALRSQGITLTFVTDAGRLGLTLDPDLAPRAAERITRLAHSGFYVGTVVHRVSPGFVVQLGDPIGDGSGGSGELPLPSETSPLPFGRLAVGLALAGQDTGSSQIFVTLAPQPDLGGTYPLIGHADPEWEGAAQGDVVRSVEVRD